MQGNKNAPRIVGAFGDGRAVIRRDDRGAAWAAQAPPACAADTHPAPTWLAALKIGGRLCFALTAHQGLGGMLATRRSETLFDARFLFPVGFIDFTGLRDPTIIRRLVPAFRRGDIHEVKLLRLGAPDLSADDV